MKLVTALEMHEIDRQTIERFGIPGRELMERAGRSVASKIKELYPQKKVIVLAGAGNNGGDGLVAAKELFSSGSDVKVLMFENKDKLSPDCRFQFEAARQMDLPVEFVKGITETALSDTVIVDAIFGTGLKRNITGYMAKVIGDLNRLAVPVISVDIPSGISADTGQVMGIAVKSDYTVTFGLPKRGHFLYPGADYSGRLFVADIGFPKELLVSDKLNVELMRKGYISSLIKRRPRYSHKGDYGHILIVAGSRGKTGAAFLSAKACMRAGAGLVTIGVPESLMDIFQARVTEEMVLPLPDKADGTLSAKASKTILKFLSEKADVLCIGPGIGVSENTQKLMMELLTSSDAPMIIDADGINSISQANVAREMLKKAKAPIILTPHTGEMARLLRQGIGVRGQGTKKQDSKKSKIQNPKSAIDMIELDRIGTALSFSKETGTCLVLKGVPTVIAGPDGRAFINQTGNPGMATAGTGDVLAGIISSFIGQGLTPLEAVMLGVYIHGLAGDIVARDKGEYSLIASDIIEALPAAFKELLTAAE